MNKVQNKIINKNRISKHSVKNGILAFLGGGVISLFLQFLFDIYSNFNAEDDASLLATFTLVTISSILTALGIYNNLGQIFGAGLFVPTTGFSNSMVSSSIEGKSEGLVVGVGSSIFALCGSVILYGIFFAFYFISIYYLLNLMGINIWA